jgi:uncharacterized phiE125 gp8 family phage protein
VSLTLVTAPTVEPVSIAEMQMHSRIDSPDDAALVQRYIKAARNWCEKFLGQAMVNTTYDLTLDQFPGWAIRLPICPLVSITSITYIDGNGVSQTIDSADYIGDTKGKPARITPAVGEAWPSTQDRMNAVTVRFVAGQGTAAANVPDHWRQAVQLLAAHWYENREAALIGTISKDLEFGVQSLLWTDRIDMI